ncbi:MarR family EPS-associated transcriptional regulator [Rhodocyclus tenuis]|uniref:EPS-associated MarR family transcriptional regulator n=1 Tax=Rhodocyclus tenuis TaxID=1066 RepID=A0A840G6H0_RHOTE|nr:MarR family EPS-associated transcriptional regulator [Rhodocyclus tenuis]MBB4246318.1 EPS-associated MarR family transcriptional regulator [Rhodocyclus tenuis]
MSPHEIAHLKVLESLAQQPQLSLRELARELGVSLGKTHYLMKALAEKGLIKASNFRRNDNKLGYLYLLTPVGVAEKLRLASAYLARKEAEYESLGNEIALLRRQVALDAQDVSSATRVATEEQTASSVFAERSGKAAAVPGFASLTGAKP